ncbi:MAG TPA: hypothetical protein VGO77_14760 [Mycobacterium sp.]|nr:hypothetical protein [Mycobacterium sp.]
MSQSGSAGPPPDAFPVRRSFGGGGVLYANRHRAKHQSGVTANTVAKILLTGSALGPTVYSGILGANTAQGDGHSAAGAIEPSGSTPNDVAKAQRQLRYLQLALRADRRHCGSRRPTR